MKPVRVADVTMKRMDVFGYYIVFSSTDRSFDSRDEPVHNFVRRDEFS